jgi:antitoxin component YwqK of YwqJK toxin-antitoxin module
MIKLLFIATLGLLISCSDNSAENEQRVKDAEFENTKSPSFENEEGESLENQQCEFEGVGIKIDNLSKIPNNYTGYFYVCYKDTCAIEITGSAVKGKRANLDEDLETYYHRNGQINATGRVWDNKTVGEWKFYYPSGNLKAKGKWLGNCRYGNWEEYYENGQLSIKLKYSDIDCLVLDGKRLEYYENGQTWSIGSFSNGTPVGEHITYFEDGQVKAKGTYEYRKGKNDDWIYFNRDGTSSDKEVY